MGHAGRGWLEGIGAAVKAHFFARRQWVVNVILSMLYGVPMQVVPKGHVGLAGAVVFWFVENGQRFMLMVRQEPTKLGGDGKARFISCLGLGKGAADVGGTLRNVITAQFGTVFARSVLGKGVLQADRVMSAPLFSHTDDTVGVAVPVQSLIWAVQVNPAMLDVIVTPMGVQALRVPENVMGSDKVSPTHKALFESVVRHLPKMKAMPATRTEIVEESVREIASGGRVLH